MAVTFEVEPLRRESALDSFSLLSRREEDFISCARFCLLLSRACYDVITYVILCCATVFILFYGTCPKNKRRISLWK